MRLKDKLLALLEETHLDDRNTDRSIATIKPARDREYQLAKEAIMKTKILNGKTYILGVGGTWVHESKVQHKKEIKMSNLPITNIIQVSVSQQPMLMGEFNTNN